MTWLAWRQFRTSALVTLAVLVAMAVALLLTGPNLVHVYDTVVKHCATHHDCALVRSTFQHHDRALKLLNIVLLAFPALLGIFWGAPLVAREFENGTFRLAWTQSVTRRRWLFTRLGLSVLAAMLASGLFSWMETWWNGPFDQLTNAPFGAFDHRDIVPIGYAAFAVTLGVAAGAIIRRTVPAMATTLVAFTAVRLTFTDWVRTHLATPLHATTAFQLPGFASANAGPSGQGVSPADWIISDTVVNRQGKVLGQNGGIGPNGNVNLRLLSDGRTQFQGVGVCPNKIPSGPINGGPRPGGPQHVSQPSGATIRAIDRCIEHFHLHEVLTYQPVSRYWTFQWEELACYLVLAVALGALTVWWVRRRLS